MPDVSILDVHLYGKPIATLTLVQGDRTIFAFNQDYVEDPERPTLSLSFKDQFGSLLTDFKPVQRVVPPFFSNLLPEGPLRKYLSERAGVNAEREFFLLWMLGRDLPGALTVHPAEGEALPPGLEEEWGKAERRNTLRFSLAGVQLKFSALRNHKKGGGLTIPAEGVGGSWIVKLPSQQFAGVPENEYSMMTIASMLGMDVPEIQLLDLDAVDGLPEGLGELSGQALAVRRFDRTIDGPVHIEDFAQVFGVYPDDKYKRASYANIAAVVAAEAGPDAADEFVRRMVFNLLIGNADMHLKNWSLIYPDRRTAALAPAYDFVATVAYLEDEKLALNVATTKKFAEVDREEIAAFARKARLPQKNTLAVALETVERFHAAWRKRKSALGLPKAAIAAIEANVKRVPLARG